MYYCCCWIEYCLWICFALVPNLRLLLLLLYTPAIFTILNFEQHTVQNIMGNRWKAILLKISILRKSFINTTIASAMLEIYDETFCFIFCCSYLRVCKRVDWMGICKTRRTNQLLPRRIAQHGRGRGLLGIKAIIIKSMSKSGVECKPISQISAAGLGSR